MRILGIDPGTGKLGFGVLDVQKGSQPKMVDAGVVTTPAHTSLPDRLEDIYDSLSEIIDLTKPEVMAIEKLFFARNVTTAISVAEARGVVELIAKQKGLEIAEYTPLQVKQALTGYGRAEKKQIQEMVKRELGLQQAPKPDDCADALAVALTHFFTTKND
ncbi:crossover junction endodeoxyribonuclease RuvC [Candidatus Saccharibacteria bacterium]|nr:crossover junction endodeoxyribonuclease RuvC [Candidatus Saccharibacteria bacterium]